MLYCKPTQDVGLSCLSGLKKSFHFEPKGGWGDRQDENPFAKELYDPLQLHSVQEMSVGRAWVANTQLHSFDS